MHMAIDQPRQQGHAAQLVHFCPLFVIAERAMRLKRVNAPICYQHIHVCLWFAPASVDDRHILEKQGLGFHSLCPSGK